MKIMRLNDIKYGVRYGVLLWDFGRRRFGFNKFAKLTILVRFGKKIFVNKRVTDQKN